MAKAIITKELIKDTLLRIYQETGEPPKYKTKILEFSADTVSKRFGSWSNALFEAGIPTRAKHPLKSQSTKAVDCTTCKEVFYKQLNQIKKYPNHFCSHSCSASHTNTNRTVSEETRAKTSASLKKYNEENPEIHQTIEREIVNGRRRTIKDRACIICDAGFKTPFDNKTCSDKCLKIRQTQAGMASQASQQRRSKGEVLFFTLCANYFGEDNVLSNAQIFTDKNGNNWDADIVVPSHRLGLCYNGIWHYQQIGDKHNLKQVQARDKIKKKVIHENGYAQYIVKDMGKFNELFVYEEFHHFIFRFLIHLELKMNVAF